MNTTKAMLALAALSLLAGVGSKNEGGAPDATAVSSRVSESPRVSATGPILLITQSGCYDLTIDAVGTPSVSPSPRQYQQVITLGVPTPVPPGPTPPPPPTPVLTERAKLLKAEADRVVEPNRAETAQGLALLYRAVAEQVRAGTVTDLVTLESALKATTDALLTRQKSAPQWVPFRGVFNTQWTALKAQGKPLSDYALLLDDGSSGLDASAGPAKAINPEFWKWLIETLLPILISLLQPK